MNRKHSADKVARIIARVEARNAAGSFKQIAREEGCSYEYVRMLARGWRPQPAKPTAEDVLRELSGSVSQPQASQDVDASHF